MPIRSRTLLRHLLAGLLVLGLLLGSAHAQTAEPAETPEPAEDTEAEDAEDAADDGDVPDLDELDKLIEAATSDSELSAWEDRDSEREPSYPRLEHHGYFRFRADLFWNGHLSTVTPGAFDSGTSALRAPLTMNAANNSTTSWDQADVGVPDGEDEDKVIAGANIRLRYQPTIHVAPTVRIHATFDILDNLVLGSTPDFAGNLSRPDVPLVAFSGAQASPTSGVVGFSDAIRVKEAYAEWQPAFLLRVGRMASHWGLGILANGGQDIDDDYGDYTDRALILLKLFGVYIAGAWDFVYAGAITEDPASVFGQPKDLGQDDDVKQWVISVFQKPLSEEEQQLRRESLYERFEPAFDWGVYGVARIQDMDLSLESYDLYRRAGGVDSYDALELVPRRAWAVVPDLWLRYEQRFDIQSGIRIELEAAAVFGEIENIDDQPPIESGDARTIQQFGVAVEAAYDYAEFTVGVDAGAASGDSAEGFGVQDQHTLADQTGAPNRELTNFKFDRAYQIDLLLFREVIGTVTNAWYFKPYVAYDFFDSPEDALGARLDLLVAGALEPDATPGDDAFLGFEADLRLFYEEKGRMRFDIEAGLLYPGPAFNAIQGGTTRAAELAVTVQSRLTLQF